MEMTAQFEHELKALLQEESNYQQWDDVAVKEVLDLISPYWHKEDENIEDYVAFEMQFFLNDTDFLCWYFEDETAQEVIEHIMEHQSNEAVLTSCMNDGTEKLSNGVIVRCTI
ncbi:hypothetical protein P6439_14110 [Staphylococcus arlettae]|nr:hypothetical protein [Staphylococcus arlettae]MDN0189162.1 hypothetical protein [Staphylococcus arlettae]MDN0189242.1 hypothetical protein [Staphylococcus arlettae]